jgi:hypothetical protein
MLKLSCKISISQLSTQVAAVSVQNYIRRRVKLSKHLSPLDRLPEFAYQGAEYDALYKPIYNHAGGPTCDSCTEEWTRGEDSPAECRCVALFRDQILNLPACSSATSCTPLSYRGSCTSSRICRRCVKSIRCKCTG